MTRVEDDTPRLAEAEVISVGATTSRARLSTPAPDDLVPGCRAIETAHAHRVAPLSYELVVECAPERVSGLAPALASRPALTEATPGGPADVILVSANPAEDVRALEHVDVVIRDGMVFKNWIGAR